MAFKIFGRKQKKACVVGLDGVPCTLLQSMIDRGVMPRTGQLVGGGTLKDMTVSLPEISSVSWSTFMTGKSPGEHGIFGFTDLKEGSYNMRFPNFRDLQSETIWDVAGKSGLKSIVINQPSTYPAREIPGVLVSGFVAIDIDKALYPKKYLATLAKARYQIDVDTQKCRDNPKMLFSELDMLLSCRGRIVNELWDKEPWNLLEVVVTGTDRLHHFMWDAWDDEAHPHHKDFLAYYAKVDHFIGHVYDRFIEEGSPENFFLLSDHGFCGTKKEAYINTALEQNGFLSLESSDKPTLDAITESSKAFALDPARIYIHRRGKYPNGGVEEADVAAIKRDLTAMFESITNDEGEKIVRRVFDGAEVYTGPHSSKGPDLLLIPKNGYDMKGRLGAPEIIGDRRLQGMHTWDDAFFLSMRNDLVDPAKDLEIVDIPWIILRSLDVGA